MGRKTQIKRKNGIDSKVALFTHSLSLNWCSAYGLPGVSRY